MNGNAEIWLGVDTLFAGKSDQAFMLYSGNAEAAGTSNAGAVIDTSAGFVGTWHLGIDLKDATTFRNHGIDSGATPATGLIGSARQFDGTGNHVETKDQASLHFGSGNFSLSAWIRIDSLGRVRQVFCKRDAEGTYELQLRADGLLVAVGKGENAPNQHNPAIEFFSHASLVARPYPLPNVMHRNIGVRGAQPEVDQSR